MTRSQVREAVVAMLAVALGWWAHGGRTVQAAPTSSAAAYQFTGINPATSLTIYSPEDRMLYVYQGATTGSSHVNCSFRIHIPRVGDAIDRENCAPGSLTR